MAFGEPNSNDLPKGSWFDRLARRASIFCGKPIVFLSATGIVLLWAISGPIFNFSDTWQLVINTGTTVITFLMVFLIQSTQNRDALAVQIKLSELILAVKGAENKIACVEELTEEQLETMRKDYRLKAENAEALLLKRKPKRNGHGSAARS